MAVFTETVGDKTTFYAEPKSWCTWRKYPDKGAVYILNTSYANGVVRGMMLNEQNEFAIGMYLIEGLVDHAPSDEELARWRKYLELAGFSFAE